MDQTDFTVKVKTIVVDVEVEGDLSCIERLINGWCKRTTRTNSYRLPPNGWTDELEQKRKQEDIHEKLQENISTLHIKR